MGIIDAFWRLIGVEEVTEPETEMTGSFPAPVSTKEITTASGNNVVTIHSNKTFKVCVSEPKRFEDAKEMADQLKNRKQVIVNLENTPSEISQRIIDFLSGTVYALDGKTQQVGRDIFVFAPSNVEISLDYKETSKRLASTTFIHERFANE